MWCPTHVQVTIQKAKDLLIKGKNDTNNTFVTIAIGKEKYQTSVKDKVGKDVQWHEQCELRIPDVGNTAAITLTVLHRSNLGLDEFLGCVSLPLSSFDVYESPKSKWYKLQGKPGKEKGKDKNRGELEVRVGFTVKASAGSLMDLSKKEKHKSSLGHISTFVSGSLLSLNSGEKKNGIKQIAKSISKKVVRKKRDSNGDGASERGSKESLSSTFSSNKSAPSNVDPGVISEDEDEFTFENLSQKSSRTSINASSSTLENLAGGEFLRRSNKGPTKPPRVYPQPEKQADEWEQKLLNKGDSFKKAISDLHKNKFSETNVPVSTDLFQERNTSSVAGNDNKSEEKAEDIKSNDSIKLNDPNKDRRSLSSSFLEKHGSSESESQKEIKSISKLSLTSQFKKKDKKILDRYVVGEEVNKVTEGEGSKHTSEVLRKFESKSRDDLIDMVIELQKDVSHSNRQLKELEDYLDQLLLKVMETTPRILQNPYVSCKSQASFNFR